MGIKGCTPKPSFRAICHHFFELRLQLWHIFQPLSSCDRERKKGTLIPCIQWGTYCSRPWFCGRDYFAITWRIIAELCISFGGGHENWNHPGNIWINFRRWRRRRRPRLVGKRLALPMPLVMIWVSFLGQFFKWKSIKLDSTANAHGIHWNSWFFSSRSKREKCDHLQHLKNKMTSSDDL